MRNNVEIVPFSWKHVGTFTPTSVDKKIFDNDRVSDEAHMWEGRAASLIVDGRTIAIGGISMMYDESDVHGDMIGNIWVFLSDEILGKPFLLHRTAKRTIQYIEAGLDLKKVQVLVSKDTKNGIQWAERLGFKPHGERNGMVRMIKWRS